MEAIPGTPDWYTFEGSQFSKDTFVDVWLLALATYGVGDVVTSIALVWFSPYHVEANPVIGLAITLFGGGGFLALKLLAFFGCLGVSVWAGVRGRDPVLFYGPPLVLTAVGVLVTAYNLWLLLTWGGAVLH